MSMATSYRYEAMTEKKSLKNALRRQQTRIETDEMMACREQQAKIEASINLKSNWNESLEIAAAKKLAKSNNLKIKSELRMANKACLMVRQAAMRQLLANEFQMYEKELHNSGKAFYIKRT